MFVRMFVCGTLINSFTLFQVTNYIDSTIFAGYGRREVVELLIAAGATLQARDDGGLQPLHNACSFGHADVVRALLTAGAAPAARDNWGYTPLHEAAAKGKVDVCIGMFH